MKLLAILNAFPYPPTTGSRIVAAHALREIARDNEVRLLTKEWGDAQLVAEWGIQEFKTAAPDGRPPSTLERGLHYIAKRSPRLTKYIDRDFKHLIETSLDAFEPDAILLFEYWAAALVPTEWRGRTLLNIEDPSSLRQRRLNGLRYLSRTQKLRARAEHWFYAQHEVPHLQSIGRVFVLSEADLEDYREATGLENLAHCPYGVSEPPTYRPRSERAPDTITITGNMFHPPNEDGVLNFLARVFPEVLKLYPSVKLLLVGASPTERILRMASQYPSSVEVTGRVKSVDDHLGNCMVAICPVELRIGVQTKILEAMRMGTPVVTWPDGNSGVCGEPGVHLELASSDLDFAQKIVELLQGKRWDEISLASRTFVKEHFSWSRTGRVILEEADAVSKAPRAKGELRNA